MEAKKSSYLIHCIIMFALTFGIGILPPFTPDITPFGMQVIGVFVGVLYGWTFLGFFWTSCFALLALSFTGYGSILNIMAEGISSTICLQVIALFIIVPYLTESGFVELVLGFFLSLKVTIGRPYVLIFMLLLSCGILTMLGLGFGGVFFAWAAMYKFFDLLGYKKGDMLVSYMIYGAGLCAGLATLVFPFAKYPIMIQGILTNSIGFDLPDIPWLVYNAAFILLFFVLYIAVGKFIFRLDVQRFRDRGEEVYSTYQGKAITKHQKLALVMMVMFIVINLLPSFLPKGALNSFLSQFGLVGGVFLIVIITSVIKIDGKPVTNWSKNATNGINWDLVMMFIATTPIANALETSEAGIMTAVFGFATPILHEMSGFVFMLVVWAAFLIITQFAHNVVVIMAFSPTVFALANTMPDVNIALLAAGIMITANAAFLTPGASSPAAAVHGNSEWVEPKHAYIIGVMIILAAVIAMTVTMPIGLLVF